MCDLHPGDLGFLVGCIDHGADAGSIGPVASDHTDELFDTVSANDEDGAAGRSAELWGAESIDVLGGVIELMLDQRHELGVSAPPKQILGEGLRYLRKLPPVHLSRAAKPMALHR